MPDDIVKEANEALEDARNGWSENYEEISADLKFLLGGTHQWDANVLSERTTNFKHSITSDQINQFTNRVVNDIRQNDPSIKPVPVDSQADVETADLLKDLIRNVEQVSNADVAYDTAVEYAVKGGLGFIQVDHDYVAPDTFEQHILIREITNPLSVLLDPASNSYDGRDARYGFKLDSIAAKDFEADYPDASPESVDAQYIAGNSAAFKSDADRITVAEWFRIDAEQKTILLLQNGLVVFSDQYAMLQDQSPVLQERVISKNRVKRYKMTGAEVLEETVFPSAYIPLIPVYGIRFFVDGKRHLISLVRNAKEPQRMYNYWASLETEWLQQSPTAPFMAAIGQLDGLPEWKNPGSAKVLRYKTRDAEGNPVGAPQRQPGPMIPAGIVNARQSALQDIKAAMGLYDASLGNISEEQSGRAILARQKQGDTATFHFADNLVRSVQHVGRIVLDMIPRVYDTPRIIRVIGDDGSPRNVAVNGAPPVSPGDRMHDIRVGKYDVVVTTGPSYATRRQEAVEAMMQLIQADPQIVQVAGDILVQNLDVPGADVLAKRLKALVPPQALAASEGKPGQDDPDALRQQLAQAGQAAQQAQASIQTLTQQLNALAQENAQNKAKADQSQFRMLELQLDARKLDLEAAKFQLSVQQAQADMALKSRQADVAVAAQGADIDIKQKTLGLQAMQTEADLAAKGIDAQTTLNAAAIEAEADRAIAHMESMTALLQA